MEPNTPPAPLLPTYTAILQEIGKHLQERKGLLAKRVLLIIWPFFVFPLCAQISVSRTLLIGWFIFSLLWSSVYSAIFAIEKRIWIDSYFDKQPLEPKESWRMARKLLWPAARTYIYTIVRYYLWPILIYLAILSLFVGIVLIRPGMTASSPAATGTLGLIVISGGLVVVGYLYFLKIRLRYVWFIFLDNYGQSDFSYRKLSQKVDELNLIAKSEAFKKSLVVSLGTDSAQAVANAALSCFQLGLEHVPGAGAIGGMVSNYGKEYAKQTTDFARIVGWYLIYRTVLEAQSGQSQEVNAAVYALGKQA